MSLLRIGISGCLMHPDPQRPVFNGRSLLYCEESLPRYLMAHGALVHLVPRCYIGGPSYEQYVEQLDGVVLHGGADMAPESYGEKPERPEWRGDRERDLYEMSLLRACLKANVPVLGICRGAQVINVFFGGTLYQDIQAARPDARVHRDPKIYERNFHDIKIEPGSFISQAYPEQTTWRINSVHHQAVKQLGKGLRAEAHCSDDQTVEAIYRPRQLESDPFFLGVQWHPEFQDPADASLLPPEPLLRSFFAVIRDRKYGLEL